MPEVLDAALEALRDGSPVILVDDIGSGQKAYFVSPASTATPEQISFFVNTGRGLVCAAVSELRLKELGLPPMVRKETSSLDFAVSVEARQGVTTGISAADRAKTLRTLAHTKDPKVELVTPGHIFPIRAKAGGVLVRSDIAEAAVDLMALAGMPPVAALCHCLNTSGELLSGAEISSLCQTAGLPAVKIADIVQRRLSTETILEKIAEARLPTSFAGEFKAVCFRANTDGAEHLALVRGDLDEKDESGAQRPVLVRVQAEHRFTDLLGLETSRGGNLIAPALQKIAERGRGVFVYVRHPRKGILAEQANALSQQQKGPNPAGELREHGIGAQILRSLGVHRIQLLTNSARGIPGISVFKLEVVGRVPFGLETTGGSETVQPEAQHQ